VARPSNETLSQVPLFAGLEPRDLDRIGDSFKQRNFSAGDTIASEGSSGAGFFVIGDGTAKVSVHGEERATLGRGDFFGEVSILLGQAPVADIVATHQLRCLVLAGNLVQPFLLDNPPVMYRMLQAQARRLRQANRWRS